MRRGCLFISTKDADFVALMTLFSKRSLTTVHFNLILGGDIKDQETCPLQPS